MARWADVVNNVATRIIVSGGPPVIPADGVWVDAYDTASTGWTYTNDVWAGPDGRTAVNKAAPIRYLLIGSEWVSTFTDDEWAWLKVQRVLTTASGKQLDKFMDAIRWTDSIDVSSPNVDPFYTWLLNNGLPGGQTRIDELRAGIIT